jgi:hypothetical protein
VLRDAESGDAAGAQSGGRQVQGSGNELLSFLSFARLSVLLGLLWIVSSACHRVCHACLPVSDVRIQLSSLRDSRRVSNQLLALQFALKPGLPVLSVLQDTRLAAEIGEMLLEKNNALESANAELRAVGFCAFLSVCFCSIVCSNWCYALLSRAVTLFRAHAVSFTRYHFTQTV